MSEYTQANNRAKRDMEAMISHIRHEIADCKQGVGAVRARNQPVSKNHPLVISFIGRFKTGKSSLINALIGAELLPTRATTATAVVTRIFRGDALNAWLVEDGKETSIPLEEAQEVILNHKVQDPDHATEILIEAPIPWLDDDVELRDTPGMDDSAQNGLLEQVAMNALKDTDLCVCVYDAGCMISGKERERTWQIHHRMGGNMVYAVNCVNRLHGEAELHEVESLCKSFFGELASASDAAPGMGKYYLMCSAPGMVDLDGFDQWLRGVVSPTGNTQRSVIRNNAVAHQFQAQAAEVAERATYELQCLNDEREKLLARHGEERKRLQKLAEKKGAAEADGVRSLAEAAAEELLKLTGLELKLEECVKGENWQSQYVDNTTRIVHQHFNENYSALCQKWPNVFKVTDRKFVSDTIDSVTLPGTKFDSVKATNGEKLSGAGIGAIIGGIIGGGPIGAAIGGAIGGMIGGSSTSVNCSVPNTASFVQSTIVPKLRISFDTLVHNVCQQKRDEAAKRVGSTGLEDVLMEAKHAENELNQLLKQYNVS